MFSQPGIGSGRLWNQGSGLGSPAARTLELSSGTPFAEGVCADFFSLARPPRSPSFISFWQAVDRASDATLHHVLAEFQQVTELHGGELQIDQKLLLVGYG